MRQSQLFVKTSKNPPKDEPSKNARLLEQAGYVDKLMAGVYTLLPLGFRVYKKIEQIIREEMNAIGGQEVYMPTLQPRERWEATGRYEGLDVLFRFTSHYTKNEYVLGPTHEEVIAPIAKRYVASYRDLPFAAYHIQNKFRDEKRAKSGLLRGREFVMKDLYSFHADQADLDAYYDRVLAAYQRIFERVGIGGRTYLTYASGGTFAKYSHEFQTLTESGEDLIYICEQCSVAVNREIIADLGTKCPKCGNTALREEKAVEVGNIFKLGTKYSAPFGLMFRDARGLEQPVIMGCYGIGLQRLMGTVVEALADDRGLVWPDAIAPFAVHLVLLSTQDEAVSAAADKLYGELAAAGIDVLYDDRKEASAGEKFADADLLGIPVRLVISAKTMKENSLEIKLRTSQEVRLIKIGDAVSNLNKK